MKPIRYETHILSDAIFCYHTVCCYVLQHHCLHIFYAIPGPTSDKKNCLVEGLTLQLLLYRHSSFTSCLFFKYVSELDSSLVEYVNPAAVAAGPTAVAAVSSSSVR